MNNLKQVSIKQKQNKKIDDDYYEMNFISCVAFVCNDNWSVQILCTTRVICMCLDCVLSTTIIEMAVFLMTIQWYAQ